MSESTTQNPSEAKRKIGLPFVLIMVGFILMPVATYLYLQPKPEAGGFDALEALRAEERLKIRQQVESEARVDLGLEPGNEYAWVDKSVGTVRIPIDVAIDKTAALLAAKPVKAADFVDAVTANALGITPHPSVLPTNAAQQSETQAQNADSSAGVANSVTADQAAGESSPAQQNP